jgi:hypothetical protein
MDDMIKNLLGSVGQMNKSIEVLKQMQVDNMAKLSEEDKQTVKTAEKVAKKFADNNDVMGLMNYLNSLQEKIVKNASTDRD